MRATETGRGVTEHAPLPKDEPVRGVFAYLEHPGILSLPGLEQVRRFQKKELPYGPLWYLTGLDLVEFGVGTATYRLPVTGWMRSGAGVITGGAQAFAADGAMGSAIFTTVVPDGRPLEALGPDRAGFGQPQLAEAVK